MKPVEPQARRLRDLEADGSEAPPEPRTHCFFRNLNQTEEDIQAEVELRRQSGAIRKGDRCIIFSWSPEAYDPPRVRSQDRSHDPSNVPPDER